MRRQKMKMGTWSALRKIAFTVGKEETDQFQKQQDELESVKGVRALPLISSWEIFFPRFLI